VSDEELQEVPSVRTIVQLMASARDRMSKANTVTITAFQTGLPSHDHSPIVFI
jgi:hypothetical protein